MALAPERQPVTVKQMADMIVKYWVFFAAFFGILGTWSYNALAWGNGLDDRVDVLESKVVVIEKVSTDVGNLKVSSAGLSQQIQGLKEAQTETNLLLRELLLQQRTQQQAPQQQQPIYVVPQQPQYIPQQQQYIPQQQYQQQMPGGYRR